MVYVHDVRWCIIIIKLNNEELIEIITIQCVAYCTALSNWPSFVIVIRSYALKVIKTYVASASNAHILQGMFGLKVFIVRL